MVQVLVYHMLDQQGCVRTLLWPYWLEFLAEEYRTSGPYLPHVSHSIDTRWIRLMPFGEQLSR
jgi:hypothetical protein